MNVPSAKPFFKEEDISNILSDVNNVLKSGRLILGPYTQKFEDLFKEYIGVKYAITVNSCTTALEIALQYFNVKNCEVIVPTNTFIATPNSVIFAGGKPVFADIKYETLCIDPDNVLEKITSKTKGIIVVHIAGLLCPQMKELKEICEDYNLFLIEDAAHAHGAMLNEKKAGSIGDVGCFSFYPTKVMTTLTGGMITTNNEELTKFAKSVRHHGQGKSLVEIVNLGNDWVMDEVSAIIGLYQLKSLEEQIKLRNNVAKRYNKFIKNIDNIETIPAPSNIRHSYYKFPVLLNFIDVDKVRNLMNEKYGIETGVLYYPPCHLQPLYKRLFNYKEGMLPTAEEVLKKQVCLPMLAQMKIEQVDYVIKSLEEIIVKENGNLKEKNDHYAQKYHKI
jgi:dTDP-4-amino-4,6-dideoxygalactose transaminase